MKAFIKADSKGKASIIGDDVCLFFRRLIIIIFFYTSHSESVAQDLPTQDYQIKGGFLFNFAQFAEWPSEAFSDSKSPIVIGILGNDPFGLFLDELVKGEMVNGRNVVIKRFKNEEEITGTHILFIQRGHRYTAGKIFPLARRESILTISDGDAFTKKGGLVRFFYENNKIRFEINVGALRQSNIVFSSKVMRLATLCCKGDSY